MSNARLRTFLAVARHGSFSAGARAIGISQPTATSQIQGLEREFNVELFHRRGRRIELTNVGRALLPVARQIAELEAEAFVLLRDSGSLNRGQLKIGAVGPFHVLEMIDVYRRNYPNIEISIHIGNTTSVLADLENYLTDVAVLAAANNNPAFFADQYARHPVILFSHIDHPFARHQDVPLQALQGQPLLRREKGSATRQALEQALNERGITPRIVMEIGSREALREAVIRGIGIGAVSAAEFIPDPRIKAISIQGQPVFTETFLYCLTERRHSLVIDSFLRCLGR